MHPKELQKTLNNSITMCFASVYQLQKPLIFLLPVIYIYGIQQLIIWIKIELTIFTWRSPLTYQYVCRCIFTELYWVNICCRSFEVQLQQNYCIDADIEIIGNQIKSGLNQKFVLSHQILIILPFSFGNFLSFWTVRGGSPLSVEKFLLTFWETLVQMASFCNFRKTMMMVMMTTILGARMLKKSDQTTATCICLASHPVNGPPALIFSCYNIFLL